MRRRMLAALVGIAALCVLTFAVPLAISDRVRVRDQVEVELRRDANRVAQLRSGDLLGRTIDPVDTSRSGTLRRAAIYDPRGRRSSGEGPLTADRVVTAALHGASTCGTVSTFLVCAEPVLDQSDVVGAARTEEPLATINDRIRTALLRLLISGAAVLGVAIVAALAATRVLLRPIANLHQAAVRLGAGDFALSIPLSHIAEIDQTSDAVVGAAARLRSMMDRERAISADVSHQLRTPITSLKTTLEAELLAPRADRQLVLTDALRDVDRLESTVSDLLALARDSPTDREILSVDTLLAEIRLAWNPIFAKVYRTLLVSKIGPLPPVFASRSAVEQILQVLISNAVEHGGGTVRVSATSTGRGGLAFRVSDDGPGIAEGSHDLFERRRPSMSGHGIGLALAMRLAQNEGGHLSLEAFGPSPTFRLAFSPEGPPASGARADRRTQ